MPKHTAIYVRVSTTDQSHASQMPDLKQWADNHDGPVRWYRDKFSGKTMDRPGWKQLEAEINAGRVTQVVIWRLDRLGRTTSGLTTLFDDLTKRKVNLVSVRDAIDLSTPAGRLMANVMASVAEYEREVIRERVLAGQANAKANGKRWGGSKKGVRKKVTPTKIKMVLAMRKEKEPITEIAKAVGLDRSTIYSVLREAE